MGERIRLNQEKPGAGVNHKTVGLNKTKSQSNQSPVDRILNLQKTIGNQAVTRLIRTGAIQASLKIGQPGDIYEKEADRVADQVMRMRMPEKGCPECEEQVAGVQRQAEEEEEEKIQTKPLAEQITPLVQRQAVSEEEEEPIQATLMENRQLQRQEEEEEEISPKTSGNSAAVSSAIESRIQSMKSGGQPLPETTRAFFEPRFGADFSQVRVHTGSEAAETAQAINARAFTTGKDIVFGSGQYSPGTSGGKRLIAHELTHVVQQGSGCLRFNGSQKKQHLRLREKLVKTKLNPGAIGLVIQRLFINGGMTGTDRVHYAGGTGGTGGNAGVIHPLVNPVFEGATITGRAPGRVGSIGTAWVKPSTGLVTVRRSYIGVAGGDQGGGAGNRWFLTNAAAARTNQHERLHITTCANLYRTYISPAETLVNRHRGRINAFSFGTTRSQAIRELEGRVDWNSKMSQFRTADIAANGAMGTIDRQELASPTFPVDCGAGSVGGVNYNHRAHVPAEACPT